MGRLGRRLIWPTWAVGLALAVLLTACGSSPSLSTGRATAKVTPTPMRSDSTLYGSAGDLYALRASDGVLSWHYHGDAHYAAPAVIGSVLYTAAETSSGDYVYALNIGDRSLRWRQQLSHPVVSSVVAVNDVLYVGLGMNQHNDPSYGAVCALRTSNGALLWCHQVGAPVWADPVIVDGTVYAGSTDDAVYALRATDGGLLWRFPTGNMVWRKLAVDSGTVYVTSYDHFLYAMRASNGALLWRFDVGMFPSAPSAAEGVVYVASDNHTIYALRSLDGSVLWRAPTGGRAGDPLAVGGVVYVGADDGSLYAFHGGNGAPLWRVAVGGQPHSLVVSDGVIYGGFFNPPVMVDQNPTGGAFAVRGADGRSIWQVSLPNPLGGAITVASGSA